MALLVTLSPVLNGNYVCECTITTPVLLTPVFLHTQTVPLLNEQTIQH